MVVPHTGQFFTLPQPLNRTKNAVRRMVSRILGPVILRLMEFLLRFPSGLLVTAPLLPCQKTNRLLQSTRNGTASVAGRPRNFAVLGLWCSVREADRFRHS